MLYENILRVQDAYKKYGDQEVDIMKVILSVYNIVYDLLLFHLRIIGNH